MCAIREDKPMYFDFYHTHIFVDLRRGRGVLESHHTGRKSSACSSTKCISVKSVIVHVHTVRPLEIYCGDIGKGLLAEALHRLAGRVLNDF